jgi:hypothetical protein
MDNDEKSNILPAQMVDAGEQPSRAPLYQPDRLELATRLMIGLLSAGSGELLRRLDELQEQVLADPGLVRHGPVTQATSNRDALRHLTIALLLRGQKRVTKSIRGGRETSMGALRWSVRALDRLTDNALGRPLRRPITRRARHWEQQLAALIQEGEIEEETSKVLASESVGLIIDEIVDFLAENPELEHMIAEIVSQKSVGFATVMADNTRTLTATADDLTDALLRRLLRRTPRRELPPSPIEGKPQTMYRSDTFAEEVDRDEG